MSIIYQSLAKLRSTGSGNPQPKTAGIPRRSLFAHKSRMVGPRVLVLTAVIFAAGVGVSYGIYQMQSEAMDTAAQTTMRLKISPAGSSPEPETAAGGSDADGPVAPATPERSLQAANSSRSTPVEEPPSPRRPIASDVMVAQASSVDPPAVAADAAPTKAVAGIARKTDRRGVVRHKDYRHRTPSAVADVDRIRRANMRRSLDISRLIAEIQQSMHAADHHRTERLLMQLSRRKGRDDPYVLKLKSYWHTQQGDLNRASALLQQVLRRNPDDLEAGINMAILEIKAGRIRAADERLTRLREMYPEDTRIPDLMEKLKS